MRVTGIHHVSILVTDVARSIAFYRDDLGLRQIERPPTFTAPELWVRDRQFVFFISKAPGKGAVGRGLETSVDRSA